ncbi:MAG: nucleoside triphosphate pyrophosphohydrolase [Frankiales bacterium]|nr:nucleoside triphosphate pyrophosphohydrolase [Frankiales bacterium]
MSGTRVTVVACSPRTAAGALSWPAWQALRQGPVLVGDPAHPQLPYLTAAGIAYDVVTHEELLARDGELVWLAGSGDGIVRDLHARGASFEVIYGSFDPPGARLLDVVAVMDRLRSEGGCPWDAKQTHTSLMPYLLEEAYETYEALETGNLEHLREELGDLLLQIAFHARISSETGWDIDDVAGDLVDKLVRRHPHVFAGASADDLEGSWEALKAAEKGRTSVTEGVPLGQPALALAAKLQRRAAKLGVPAVSYDGLGGELWALVARCQAEGLDPEAELRTVARGFRDRLATLESRDGGRPVSEQEWRDGFAG